MKRSSLDGLVICAASVRDKELGFVLARDPRLAARGVEHTISFRWKKGVFNSARAKYGAAAICIVERPEYGVVKISSGGTYSLETREGIVVGNLFRQATPARRTARYGDLRSVTTIDGRAYAVGFEGMVYRLDGAKQWTRIDDGLPKTFDIEAIDGFDDDELFAAGFRGQLWARANGAFRRLPVDIDATLTSVCCSDEGDVYVAGHRGALLRRRRARWKVLPQKGMPHDIWALAWFDGRLYASTLAGLYRLTGDRLEEVDFGADRPKTTHRLSACADVLWSIGSKDLMAFDGGRWTRLAGRP